MIVPVKKVKLAVLNDYEEALLKNLQRYGLLMLIPLEEREGELPEDELLARTEKSLRLVREYQSKAERNQEEHVVAYEEFMRVDESRKELLMKIENSGARIEALRGEIKAKEDAISFYRPWRDLPVPGSRLGRSRYSVARIGFIKPYDAKSFAEAVENIGAGHMIFDRSSDGLAVAVVCYLEDDEALLNILKTFDFHEITLPEKARTPAEVISRIEEELSALRESLRRTEAELQEYTESSKELELLSDQLKTQIELKQAPVMKMPRAAYLEGWVREDRVDALKRAITEVTDIYDLDIADPAPEEEPPTVVENKKFVEPFESITEMYSLPHPDETDPNPALSFWYLFIFGMMMGDAGYGFIISLATFLFLKIKKPKDQSARLLKVFFYAGIATILWGAAYGSYFGFTVKPNLIEPMNDPLKMLIVSLAVGGLHIITGILIKAYDDIRRGRYFDALFDQFSWVLILAGLGMLFVPGLDAVGGALAVTGAAIILVTGGRKSKGVFGKLFGGLGGLYNVTGYLSDILSYSRILALSLSTAIIGWVMNMLAGMFTGSAFGYIIGAVIFIVGHLFNLVMGILSAYVHDLRLQFIEFFNRFYQGGGYPFEPLSLKLQYVDKVKIGNLQGGINHE